MAAFHKPSPTSQARESPVPYLNRTVYARSLRPLAAISTLKRICKNALPLKIDEISPEWLLILTYVFLSLEKTSSRTTFVLASCAPSDSLTTGSQKGSCSANPFSNVHSGYISWMADLLLRRSQVCTPIFSRNSSLMMGAKGLSAGRDRPEKVRDAVCRHRTRGLV